MKNSYAEKVMEMQQEISKAYNFVKKARVDLETCNENYIKIQKIAETYLFQLPELKFFVSEVEEFLCILIDLQDGICSSKKALNFFSMAEKNLSEALALFAQH